MSAALHPGAKASFDAQGLMTHFGAVMTEATQGRCVIEAPMSDKVTQQGGRFHGGAIASIADAACGHAAMSAAPDGSDVLSIEFKLNLLAAADGETIRATAEVHRQGRTISVVGCRIESLNDGTWSHCAEMLATMFVKPPKAVAGGATHG